MQQVPVLLDSRDSAAERPKGRGETQVCVRQRRRHRWYVRFRLLEASAVLLCCTSAVFAFFQWRSARLAYQTASTASVRSLATAKNRSVYAHSVVPGGVFSQKDLEQAAARDTVVSAHYHDLVGRRLEPVVLQRGRQAFVSFRLANAVYWTKQPVRLRRAELVLTDGVETVRARGGNRTSLTPREPTAPIDIDELDMVLLPPGGALADLPVGQVPSRQLRP